MLYDIAFLIFSIFYLPALVFKGKMHADFGERFGNYAVYKRAKLASAKDAIWIQAVSVGEVALCKSLIPELKKRFPSRGIVLSTITKTGNDLAKRLFGSDALVIYFPLDFSFIVKKVIALIRPKLYVMVETEIWPNVLREIERRGTPSILINGRISDRSFGKYRIAKFFLKSTLSRIDRFCMQSPLDAERIISLGAPREKISVTGNMKFDTEVKSDETASKKIADLMGLGTGDKLFVAGSTHRGEETIIVETFESLSKEFPELKLLIAPRHIERAAEVEAVVKNHGFTPVRLSTLVGPQPTVHSPQIFILDTIGQLGNAYAIAPLVFVGGSLVSHGGQNPIEPSALGKAVIFGPYMFNFREITRQLIEAGGAIQVADKVELLEVSKRLLANDDLRIAMGRKAREQVLKNCGATERNIKIIGELINA